MHADDIDITSPCPLDLREHVRGTSKRFHCEHCARDVHLLSNMTEAEAAVVLASRDRDKLCVAFVHGADGQLRFRDTRPLVPASRLGGPQRALRASTMALSLAACTAHGDRVEAVNLEGHRVDPLSRPRVMSRPDPEIVAAGGISDDAHSSREPSKPGHVDAVLPTAIHTPELDKRKIRMTEAARQKRDSEVKVSFCIDQKGRVVHAKRVRGDEELAKLVIENVERWRFRRRVEAQLVCTDRNYRFRFI